jgi:hypothetical protein
VPSGERLGAALLCALLAAALIVAIVVFRERSPDLALEVLQMNRSLPRSGLAEIEFFTRYDDDDATIEIVGRNKVTARTLAAGVSVRADELMRCTWDATDDEGQVVEPGRYRLRVVLPDADRDMIFPRRLRVRAKDARRLEREQANLLGEPLCEAVGPRP